MANDKNYVSFWFWFFALLFSAVPCIGTVFSIIFAFAGGNESRKNYFRAVLAWQLLIILAVAAFHALGLGVVIYNLLREHGWQVPAGWK
jgi:hypothetical protein